MRSDIADNLFSGYGELWSAQILTRFLNHRKERPCDPAGGDSSGSAKQGDSGGSPIPGTEDGSFSRETSVDRDWEFVDARRVILVDRNTNSVKYELSREALAEQFLGSARQKNLVCTGFIASYLDGGATTLGRDGSDFSASIFGNLLAAVAITIWTDVGS